MRPKIENRGSTLSPRALAFCRQGAFGSDEKFGDILAHPDGEEVLTAIVA